MLKQIESKPHLYNIKTK